MNKNLLGRILVGLTAATIVSIGAVSCGRPDDADINSSMRGGSDYTPVDGLSAFGSQCPYGDVGGVKPLRLQMWNCPVGAGTIKLTEDIQPLYLQADCKTRILNVRSLDRRVDTSWYFLPDGEFDVVVDGVSAHLKTDGSGHDNCNAPLAINISGRVMCGPEGPNQDKATIKFQSVMWAGKRLNTQGNSPVVAPSTTPGLPPPPAPERVNVPNQCNLPASCYFYTQSEITQCQ
jgi:hypothetical protein